MRAMDTRIRVGTSEGLWEIDGDRVAAAAALAGMPITAVAEDGGRSWAIVDGRTLWWQSERGWEEHAEVKGLPATCLAPTSAGLLIGTEQAHLLKLTGDTLEPVAAFDATEGRDTWYTPWGDPADVRSIASAVDGTIHANVHVGGVARSRDRGRSWTPTLDIEEDVHQVLAHPTRGDVVLVAAAEGFGVSRDGGNSWQMVTAGLHAHYLRAVAISGETVLVSASTGPGGRRSALYRKRLDGDDTFERCRDGLPTWFDANIDTACLAAAGPVVVFGTEDGRVFQSLDGGARWEMRAKGLPSVTSVTLR
jgi:hypothetical protein